MKSKVIGLISATALALAAAAPALAGQINWNFYTLLNNQGYNNTDIGSTNDTFTQATGSIYTQSASQLGTADAIAGCDANWCNSALDLFAKNAGTPSEQGLGLASDPYGTGGEIFYPNAIYVSTADLPGPVTSFTLGSVQGTSTSGENWAVLGWNGTSWDTLGSGTGGDVVTLNDTNSAYNLGNYTDFIIAEPNPNLVNGSNDIVLMSMTTVPEPGTLALLAAGLAAIGLAVSRRRKTGNEA